MEKLIKNLVTKYNTNCPFTIAENLNINLIKQDLGSKTQGFYLRVLRRRYIAININLSPEWQRFICAHELGHDRLHKGWGYYFIEEQTFFKPGKFEREANNFALQLLTYGEQQQEDEPIHQFWLRNNIPMELHTYFFK